MRGSGERDCSERRSHERGGAYKAAASGAALVGQLLWASVFFCERATLPSDKSAVLGITITADSNPTMVKTGSDGVFRTGGDRGRWSSDTTSF